MSAPLLEVRGLTLAYPARRGPFARAGAAAPVLQAVDLALERGRTLALVGESGSGKTSVARALLGLVEPSAGEALYRRAPGAQPLDLFALSGRRLRVVRRELGLVFQDPYQSLNPRLPVLAAVAEPLRVHGLARGRAADVRAAALLERVGLEPAVHARYPHEFSGGQRQRIALARALALGPRVLVLDEAVSALDASVRAQILNLLLDLQAEGGLAYLFITHDLALARAFAPEVAVMERGRIVEHGPTVDVLAAPRHAATRRLVEKGLTGVPRR
jgi:peptide/nickel transport system ATP-binding protein